MNNRKAYIIYIVNSIVFIALEAVALSMVSNNSVVQRSEIIKALSAVSNTLSGTTGSITGYFSLGRVNDRLADENAALRIENDRLKAQLERTAGGLDSLMTQDSLLFDYIPAAVISNSTDRLHNILIINKGKRDGVKEDMGVITDRGIVGYVLSAGEKYSKISSLLDTDNMASAILSKSNTFGIIQWDGKHTGRIILHDIPVHTEVAEGDTVISSGYSLIYPAGLPLGTVAGKELRDGVNYDVTVNMFEDFSKLRHVYVAVRKDIGEIYSLTDGSKTQESGS